MWNSELISRSDAPFFLPTPKTFPLTATQLRRPAEARFMTRATAASSFYELLGVSDSGTLPEIKQAYKDLARRFHPDVAPPGMAGEYTSRFIRVQEAYETLSDPGRRAEYDRDMARGPRLAFSGGRRRCGGSEGAPDKSEFRIRWQAQLSELKRRSMYRDAGAGNESWGARMRRQMNQSPDEL